METPDTESFLDANSTSFSSYHRSDFQPDPSGAFTPPSWTTTVDENIIARTHDAASTIPHINCSHKRQKNYMVDIYDETMEAAFNHDYELYARTSHMGILDPTYKIFTSQDGYGSLIYKIQDGTVIVTGDPLCSDQCRGPLLNELRRFRWARGLSLAFVGVSEDFAMYAQNRGWMAMSFGHERVLNPLTSKVLRKEAGKRMLSQNKQLLDRKRGGVSIHLYNPGMTEIDLDLEEKLQDLYDDWRSYKNRENEGASRAFVTVYDLFSYTQSTMFLYTTDSKCNVNGFAALRSLGTQPGYHIDPCIASQDAPRGITDLLIITAMQLLQSAGIGFLSLGFEPIDDLQEIKGQTNLQSRLWRRGYKHTIKSVPVVGKAAYFRKFHPDESLGSKLFICLPTKGIPLRSSIALLHFANMSVRQLFTQAKPIQQHK